MNEKIAKIFVAVCVVCAMIAMAACNSGGSDLPVDEPDSAQSSEYVGEISESNSVSNAQTTVNDTTQKANAATVKNTVDDRALYEAFLKTKSWQTSVSRRVETASEYEYDYNNFKCGKYYYDLDGDGRLELFICLSYQRGELQYSFPYILDIKGTTVFCAYEFQSTCPVRYSNHITLLQGTDKNYYFIIDSNDGGIYDAAGKYRYCDGKLIHIDSVHAYNTTGSLESGYPAVYYVSGGADLYLNNVIKDWKSGSGDAVESVDENTYETRKDALYKGTEIVYYYS